MIVIIPSHGTTPTPKPASSSTRKLKKRIADLEDRVAQLELQLMEQKLVAPRYPIPLGP